MKRGFLLGAASNDRGPRAAVTGKVRSVARSPDPMPSTIELVPIPVGLASGKQFEFRLAPSDTVAELQARVERLDEAWLCEARLLAGQEKLSAGVLVAELAARLGCGDFVQAVLIKSAHKALLSVESEAKRFAILRSDISAKGRLQFAECIRSLPRKLTPALEIIAHLNDSISRSRCTYHDLGRMAREVARLKTESAADALACTRFAGMAKLLMHSVVLDAHRQLHRPDRLVHWEQNPHGDCSEFFFGLFEYASQDPSWQIEEFNELVIDAISDPDWFDEIAHAWWKSGGDGGLRAATEWLATEHSQPAVRAAASRLGP